MEFKRKTFRHLGIYQLVQRSSEICGIGLVSGGGAEAPDLSYSGLCGVIDESQLVAIGISNISAVETFAVMRAQARSSLVRAAVV